MKLIHLTPGTGTFHCGSCLRDSALIKSLRPHGHDPPLAALTVGSLLGEKGRRWPKWNRLLRWMEQEVKPEAVSRSNALLIGLAPAIARRLRVPVVCAMQGEDVFLDSLAEPYRARAWGL